MRVQFYQAQGERDNPVHSAWLRFRPEKRPLLPFGHPGSKQVQGRDVPLPPPEKSMQGKQSYLPVRFCLLVVHSGCRRCAASLLIARGCTLFPGRKEREVFGLQRGDEVSCPH